MNEKEVVVTKFESAYREVHVLHEYMIISTSQRLTFVVLLQMTEQD
jgi:hypothetical protein